MPSKHFHFEMGKNLENYVQVWMPCLVKPQWLVEINKNESIDKALKTDVGLVAEAIISCLENMSDIPAIDRPLRELLIDFELSVFCLSVHFSSEKEEQEMKDMVLNKIINREKQL